MVCLVGDGSFLFGVPSSSQWVARRYRTPALTVIYNNRGWKPPKMSALAVHPKGAAAEADDFNVSFAPAADLPGVALASPRRSRSRLAAGYRGRPGVLPRFLVMCTRSGPRSRSGAGR